MLNNLSEQQKRAVLEEGNTLITACPGSGKTRVLAHKVAFTLNKLELQKQYVVAVTFTNRAADEVRNRIDAFDISNQRLWTGTIHSFCLEWILRPYSCYCDRIKNGFTVIDQFASEALIDEIKNEQDFRSFDKVNVSFNRNGDYNNKSAEAQRIADAYHKTLIERKWIDFDLILYLSYFLLCSKVNIAKALAKIISLICIDEYQDTQDLQYGILCKIIKAGQEKTKIFLVGDPDQAIYGSLGGVAKSLEEIQTEIAAPITHYELSGNYRSCQRIIDFYCNFQTTTIEIEAIGDKKDERGIITYQKAVPVHLIHENIAKLIQASLDKRIPDYEICVLAPRWLMITAIAKRLIKLLPNVSFDAPGLSPLRRNRENFWFKVARLFLTDLSPGMLLNRLRWANELIRELELCLICLDERCGTNKKVLKIINSIKPVDDDGITYLEKAFTEFMGKMDFSLDDSSVLQQHWESFFAGAKKTRESEDVPTDIESFRRMFKEKKGVVINTCHGAKGEEYETIIAFGLLRGYIPHWDEIIGSSRMKEQCCSNKLLYVIGSRAKTNLHLISEVGRKTQSKRDYEINEQLNSVSFDYDSLVNNPS